MISFSTSINYTPRCYIIVYLYLSCVRAKITVQRLLRDIGWLVVRSTGCAVVLQVSLHFTVKVTCSSVWLCCIGSLPPESNEIYSTVMLRKATKVNCVCPRF